MPVYDAAVRRDVADYARRYFAGKITLETFLEYSAGTRDPLILALRAALVHEPPREGLLGLRERWWRSRFLEPVKRLLQELDQGSAGQVPTERVYPRIALWQLVCSALFLLVASLVAARHLNLLLTDLHQGVSLPFWDALWRSTMVGTLGMVAGAGLDGWIYRLHLYRTRKFLTDSEDPGR